MPCAAGENFRISIISIEKNTYFTKVWGTHMLIVCLGILKNLPQYAYKLYAYKKKTCILTHSINTKNIYRNFPIMSPWAYLGFCSNFWAYFRVGLFSGGLTFGWFFVYQKVGLIFGMDFQNSENKHLYGFRE